jgi:hypothetical protein
MGSKIAILGSHSQTRMKAPFKDTDWAIWACSPGNMNGVLPRVDAWFEMHIPAQAETRPNDYMDFLKTLPVVYLRDTEAAKDMPGAVLYPDDAMKQRFGRFFFTSSIAYLFAYAITQAPDEIGLWGVHMASHEEYANQRAGCHYFIQKAWEAGIKVSVPSGVTLLNPPADRW